MKKILLGFIAIGLLTFVGCKKDDDTETTGSTETSSDEESTDATTVDESKLPTVTTLPIDSFGPSNLSALLKGIIVSEGGSTVTSRGFCWDSLPTVDINSNKSENGAGTGSFSQLIDGLEGYTTYYVRAYAINNEGIKYGDAVSFSTDYVPLTDIDGNVYASVTIGTQEWMAENLRTSKYNDGTSIPNVTDDDEWGDLSTGAWCHYNNFSNYDTIFGKSYNWYAVETGKLCPTGWHVPTDEEWTVLEDYLTANGHSGTEGKALKATSFGGTNDYGWLGLPGGSRFSNGSFFSIGNNGNWWSSSQNDASSAWSRYLYNYDDNVGSYNGYKKYGFSVRCVKD